MIAQYARVPILRFRFIQHRKDVTHTQQPINRFSSFIQLFMRSFRKMVNLHAKYVVTTSGRRKKRKKKNILLVAQRILLAITSQRHRQLLFIDCYCCCCCRCCCNQNYNYFHFHFFDSPRTTCTHALHMHTRLCNDHFDGKKVKCGDSIATKSLNLWRVTIDC